jgi:hypothetical protein
MHLPCQEGGQFVQAQDHCIVVKKDEMGKGEPIDKAKGGDFADMRKKSVPLISKDEHLVLSIV